MSCRFVIPGPPQGKARARTVHNPHTGRVQSYTPDRTARYEELVRLCYRRACGAAKTPTGLPVSVEILARFPVPCSASGPKRRQMHDGIVLPTKKPDADNVAKIVCDALNGVAYQDDKQICSLTVVKKYEDGVHPPGVYVIIREDPT